MNLRHMERLAAGVIQRTMQQLPASIREASESCLIEISYLQECLQEGEALEEDLLGLFEGRSHADDESALPTSQPRIRLFLDNLWDYAGHDPQAFREEIRITLLHELGHYLGLDEAQVEALGLA